MSPTIDCDPEHAAGMAAHDDDRALSPGATLGGYRILAALGEGGMGRVYLAEHPEGGRVALKVLRRALVSPRGVERFFAEAEAVNRIRHPSIIEVKELFVAEGMPCIVMEHLEGRTLSAEIALGALAPARVVAFGVAIARALAATHAAGVVHRDLKPDNIFLVDGAPTTGDRSAAGCSVKILDFGVATFAHAASSAASTADSRLGTPEYMAPEQLAGRALDARADIYALGITLYQACAGRLPFVGVFGELVVRHLTQPPPPLRAPPALERAILAMLEKEPANRPATMLEVEELLTA